MARRRRGRPVHGWLVLDKPEGLGSTQAVAAARRVLDARKAGHAGTLDPMATGVLAIAFGEATKTVSFAMDALKTYRFTVRWGAATDTDDAAGAVIARTDARPDPDVLAALLPEFQGRIMQRPPNYSAVKIAGARAYDLARQGVDPAPAARPIRIERLSLLETPDPEHTVLEMVCGKGGYVRSVARDLGERLGCLGHVSRLRRLRSGGFGLERAISFELLGNLSDREAAEEHLLPSTTALDDIPALAVDAETAASLRCGRAAPLIGALAESGLSSGDTAWASLDGEAVAVGVVENGCFQPKRVFDFQAE